MYNKLTEINYTIKHKCIKALHQENLSIRQKAEIRQQLSNIIPLVDALEQKDISVNLKKAHKTLMSYNVNIRQIEHFLECALTKLKKISEKKKIMSTREKKASMSIHRENEQPRCNTLSVFDIIYTPTQGGNHYCIISDLIGNSMVRCFPITTASNRQLEMLGCQSVAISPELRLSSNFILLDIERAKCRYINDKALSELVETYIKEHGTPTFMKNDIYSSN